METIINQRSAVGGRRSEISDETLADFGFYWRERNGVKLLVCPALEENGFANGFSTRLGGVSQFPADDLNLAGFGEDADENIFENRRRFLRVFDNDFLLSTVWQVHGDAVKTVKTLDEARDGNGKFDALASNLPNVLIGVKTADCVPVLIGDAKTKAFAAVHAGWRGTVESIVKKSIEKMQAEFKTKPENLICAIGAAATCKNYEIGRDVLDAFGAKISDSEKFFTPTRENHALVNLHLANKEQLISTGVSPENIYVAPFCTMERTDLFFSYRREKKLYGKTGRLLSVIGLKRD
ncbi:MAG: peptidoglycan editing factor PgeF [Acidobacteriota bacterium]|nr:peptidoglycan editing factor PgeF [Acidobacteriota bacterium]